MGEQTKRPKGSSIMPKFYRRNKKRIDPRYFLKETTNRSSDDEPPWGHGGQPASGGDPMTRARELAFAGMRSADGSPSNKPGSWKENQEILVGVAADDTGGSWEDPATIRGITDDGHLEIEWGPGSDAGRGRIDVINPNETPVRLASGSSDTDSDGTSDADELEAIAQNMRDDPSGTMAGSQLSTDPNIENIPRDQRPRDQWGNIGVSGREHQRDVKDFQKHFREKTPPGGWSLKK